MEVTVVARSWAWDFQYEDGRITTNELFVPAGKPVRLRITSNMGDVIHSFFVPNFRLKKDAVPGMYNLAWFESSMVGQHIVFCTEYCGAGHSMMNAKVVVLDEARWQLWRWGKEIELPPWVGFGGMTLDDLRAGSGSFHSSTAVYAAPAEDLVLQGAQLMRMKGCVACHSDDGSVSRVGGPSFLGLYGSEVELSDGRLVIADEDYIRESILRPQAKITKGFENRVMPPYPGNLSEREFSTIIAYLKSLSEEPVSEELNFYEDDHEGDQALYLNEHQGE